MSYKKKIFWLLVCSLVGFIVSAILTSPSFFGLCSSGEKFCLDPYDEIIGQPLGIFSICLFIIFIALLFFQEQVFRVWSKFALFFLFISIIIISVTPAVQGSLLGFDKESATLFLASIFLISSLILIWSKSRKLRREGE